MSSSQNDNVFEVNVQYPSDSGEVVRVKLQKNTTIAQLKLHLEKACNVQSSQQRIIFGGQILTDPFATVEKYGISDGCTIQLMEPLSSIAKKALELVSTTQRRYCVQGVRENKNQYMPMPEYWWKSLLKASGARIPIGDDTMDYPEGAQLEHIRQSLLSADTYLSQFPADHSIGRLSHPYARHSHAEVGHRQWYVGQWIDVLDTVQMWLEGTIMSMTSTHVFVHYNGWPTKWDEWIHIDSDRLCLFRTRTYHLSLRTTASPDCYVWGHGSAPTGEENLERMVDSVSQLCRMISSYLDRSATVNGAASASSTPPPSFSTQQPPNLSMYRDIAPLMDRTGRAMVDLAHALSFVASNGTIPEATSPPVPFVPPSPPPEGPSRTNSVVDSESHRYSLIRTGIEATTTAASVPFRLMLPNDAVDLSNGTRYSGGEFFSSILQMFSDYYQVVSGDGSGSSNNNNASSSNNDGSGMNGIVAAVISQSENGNVNRSTNFNTQNNPFTDDGDIPSFDMFLVNERPSTTTNTESTLDNHQPSTRGHSVSRLPTSTTSSSSSPMVSTNGSISLTPSTSVRFQVLNNNNNNNRVVLPNPPSTPVQPHVSLSVRRDTSNPSSSVMPQPLPTTTRSPPASSSVSTPSHFPPPPPLPPGITSSSTPTHSSTLRVSSNRSQQQQQQQPSVMGMAGVGATVPSINTRANEYLNTLRTAQPGEPIDAMNDLYIDSQYYSRNNNNNSNSNSHQHRNSNSSRINNELLYVLSNEERALLLQQSSSDSSVAIDDNLVNENIDIQSTRTIPSPAVQMMDMGNSDMESEVLVSQVPPNSPPRHHHRMNERTERSRWNEYQNQRMSGNTGVDDQQSYDPQRMAQLVNDSYLQFRDRYLVDRMASMTADAPLLSSGPSTVPDDDGNNDDDGDDGTHAQNGEGSHPLSTQLGVGMVNTSVSSESNDENSSHTSFIHQFTAGRHPHTMRSNCPPSSSGVTEGSSRSDTQSSISGVRSRDQEDDLRLQSIALDDDSILCTTARSNIVKRPMSEATMNAFSNVFSDEFSDSHAQPQDEDSEPLHSMIQNNFSSRNRQSSSVSPVALRMNVLSSLLGRSSHHSSGISFDPQFFGSRTSIPWKNFPRTSNF